MPWQVLWLEEYLMRWKKTLVVVSHDRDFLNNVTTDIVHLHDLGLHFYRCRSAGCLAPFFYGKASHMTCYYAYYSRLHSSTSCELTACTMSHRRANLGRKLRCSAAAFCALHDWQKRVACDVRMVIGWLAAAAL